MKHFSTRFVMMVVLVMSALSISAQQLPNAGFEDWSGAQFDGNIQLKNWTASNVEQLSFKFNFLTRETGRSGYCAYIANKEVGAMGIYQTSPGYFTLGTPWQYLPSITAINDATGGTDGGINMSYRPDSMYVWVKRSGANPTGENFSLLFYSWKGTAQGNKYKANKSNSCTTTAHTDEESDIRQALDANSCGTTTKATQVAEGFYFQKAEYSSWTLIKVPIYYFNDEVPQKCNVVFSSSGYPNFRNSAGIIANNGLYVDDVSLVYSSKIQQLYIGGKLWNGFDPNSSAEQVYSVGHTTTVPEVYAVRGAGSITNIAGTKVNMPGRRLSGNEINIQYGTVDGAATVITVTAADGSSTTTYRIKMVQAPSDNAKLNDIQVNGESISGYNPMVGTYNVSLPYGTTAAPVVTFTKGEEGQNVTITQAGSPTGTATISVTAPDGTTTKTYTISFSVAPLADNTLVGIKVNGEPIADFIPTMTTYRVELPLSTTVMPTVEAISAYPAGAQTIVYTAPSTIDNGQYKISVTTPGNPTAKVYKLNFKITASTNSRLSDLQMGSYIVDFSPSRTTYYVTLPMGTTALPAITYTKGDASQTVVIEEGGVDGTTKITVTAASGDQTIYKIICSTEKSEASHLNNIFIGGVALEGFNPNVTSYTYNLPIGTTELPAITWEAADEFETIIPTYGGMNGTTRLTVTAGNGNTTIYKITFTLETSSNATLDAIYVAGELLEGFDPNTLFYLITLPKGTTELPVITWTQHDEWQTVTPRYGGVNGDTKITVRPQTGISQTYTLQFRVMMDTINHLEMINLNGEQLHGFHPDTLTYVDSLPVGVSAIPAITYVVAAQSETVKVLNAGNTRIIRVTAEDGSVREYSITFIITKLESAFPKMIYVNGDSLPGFDKNELNYVYEFEGESAPAIAVEKDGNQQVTILTPVLEGTATIIVRPEDGGEGNTYTIIFRLKTSEDVMLSDILLDGEPMQEFSGARLDYTIPYTDHIPEVTFVAAEGQMVTRLMEKNIVRLYVVAGDKSATYTLTFDKQFSSSTALENILLNGVAMPEYADTIYSYALTLPAGSTVPEIGYTKGHEEQVVYLGQAGENKFTVTVIAENGEMAVYTIDFTIELFTSTTLLGIALDDVPLELEDGVYTYTQSLYDGASLPVLTVTKDEGQTVLVTNTSSIQQQVLVKAENGDVSTYTINYTIVRSDDATLRDILLDGVSLDGFNATTYAYTHELAWRRTVVPVIQPVSSTPGQTITINYGAINATTYIHVVAADGVAHNDYSIAFPVHKSDNTMLEAVEFEDVNYDFQPQTNNYVIDLPYQTKAVPTITYFPQEAEQTIEFINAPISDTTKLIVTAENGDKRTYTFAFNVPLSDKSNVLRSLVLSTNLQSEIVRDITAEDKDTIAIALPYGTKEFNVGYIKNYDEQTVLVQPGGIFRATKITVRANRGDEADKIYYVIPDIDPQNPAVLKSLAVNGIKLADFNKNRFSYIVKVTSGNPIITFQAEDGAIASPTIVSSKHWQAVVSKDGFTNTYDLWFYYKDDVLPNTEFTDWEPAAFKGQKPVGWNTLGHFTEGKSFTLVGTYTTGNEVTNDNGVVKMESKYNAFPLGGYVPAYITLGKISASFSIAAGSDFAVSGGIQFRNTPDELNVNFKSTSLSNNASRIIYQMNGQELVYTNSEVQSNFKTVSLDLRATNEAAGTPQTMNIILNSFETESGSNGLEASSATMYVDWARFSYSSKLNAIYVNGEKATLSGNKFVYTLPSSEDNSEPILTFEGDVEDQARLISWTKETSGKRIATIKNFAEDSTMTQYRLEVTRPLSTVNTLAGLEVDGMAVEGWSAEQMEYIVTLPFGQKHIPDVRAIHGSNLQTVVTSLVGNVATITVTPESGANKVYTITFIEAKSNDVTLAGLSATGVEYDPDVKQYNVTAASLPDIRFVKQSDGQTVILRNGQLFIIAEDGESRDTITITNTPAAVITSGKLIDLSLDGNTIEGFNMNLFEYTKPRPAVTSFTREFDSDHVKQIITPDSIIWEVTGNSEHRYLLAYPTEVSSDIALDTIFINGEPLEGFNAAETEYTIYNNEPISIDVHTKPGQTLNVNIQVSPITRASGAGRRMAPVSRTGLLYTLLLTAEDGLSQERYTIEVLPEMSSDASLKMIRLNGIDLAGYQADSTTYKIILPTTDPKIKEQTMPSITYVAGHYGQTITVDTAHIGGTSYINVTSEDGMEIRTYELLIQAEPSHNTELDGLMLDGQLLPNFSADRHYYSAEVEDLRVHVAYSSVDRFQRVDTILNGNVVTVRVMAQDSVTVNDYVIELYTKPLSADVSLADILLNGQSFSVYDDALMPFNPMNSFYTIPVYSNQPTPDVSATLNSIGQTMDITENGDSVFITVKAEDGIHSNIYTLFFKREYSDNTALARLEIGDSLLTLIPGQTNYQFVLPVGEKQRWAVYYELSDYNSQREENEHVEGNTWMIDIIAESGLRVTYSVEFVFTLSANARLSDITANDVTIEGFAPDSLYYSYVLPMGERNLPELRFEKGDEWQRDVKVDTITSAYRTTWQCTVWAEDNIHSTTYTIVYEVQPSDVDTLQSISVANRPLEDFDGHVMSYTYHLPKGTTAYPNVDCEPGDQYQDTISQYVGNVYAITVTAENGRQRTYTITFDVARNDDATLQAIYCGGEALANFDPETYNYTVTLPYGVSTIPMITYVKNDSKQQDVMTMEGGQVLITVTAEDGTQQTYTIAFVNALSPEAGLAAITIDGEELNTFDPDTYEYTIVLPYGTTSLPEVSAVLKDTTAAMEIVANAQAVVISTTSADEQNFREYTVLFDIERCAINALADLSINGTTIEGFSPDSLFYTIEYPQGADATVFVHADDLSWTVADTTATVTVSENNGEIQVMVTADNGNVRVYVITQTIKLSSNSLLSDLTINQRTVAGFSDSLFNYSYIILEGETLPEVDAVPQDSLAEYSVSYGADVAKVFCTAQDGSETVYVILFETSSLNTGAEPTSTDVLLKQIKGSETFAAYSIRLNTYLAIYDDKGLLYYNLPLPVCNPNDAVIALDARGNEVLTDATGDAAYFRLPNHGQTFFYLFYSNGDRISSGKFIVK